MDSNRQHPNRRVTDDGSERRESLESRMDKLEAKLDANTEMTQRSTELFANMEAGIRVLGALGALAKWFAPILSVGIAVWALLHGGERPPTAGK